MVGMHVANRLGEGCTQTAPTPITLHRIAKGSSQGKCELNLRRVLWQEDQSDRTVAHSPATAPKFIERSTATDASDHALRR